MKISGLDQLQRTMKDAEKALTELDGELGTVNFDPSDPSSIECAIQDVVRMVDHRVGAYSSNAIIGPLAEELKEKYRAQILEKATAARMRGMEPDDSRD